MPSKPPFPIVGIGASAGGIPALQAFFEHLPAGPDMAFVIVTHMNPDRQSALDQILRRYTKLPVVVAGNDMRVEPGHVYVMPSDVILTIREGRLRTRDVDRAKRERKPVDVFLSSLAEDQGEYAVAIILSGGDGDGTLGAKAVREAGGLAIAQGTDGSGPLHPEMPESAIASGVIDMALPAEEMGRRLVDFSRGMEGLDDLEDIQDARKTRERSDLARVHQQICSLLASHSGHDFSGYKPKTFFRRVQRRMQIRQQPSMAAYVELLRKEPQEVSNLFRDLLINVTSFFRDKEAFAALEELVIPKLFDGKGASDVVRIWVPGCATGEEVYSIAILIRERMNKLKLVPKVMIFATDIDEPALAIARAGRYPAALLESVSPERLQRFFKSDGDAHIINSDVRELCIFSPHSLIRDPPFSRMDMVSCRNLLIYFGPVIQRQVIPTFHYSLKPGGYLFLGSSESVGQHGELFATVDKKQRIFQARAHPVRPPLLPALSSRERSFGFSEGLRTPVRESAHSLRHKVEGRVLERYVPPHVVVNADADIVYYSNGTGRFLETPQGAPSRQLLALARKGLRLDLRAALQECLTTRQSISREGISVELDDGLVQLVDLTVEPVNDRDGDELLYLVVFQAQGPARAKHELMPPQGPRSDDAAELERELRDARERLQSTIEEYETALEELKSSNEELVSLNEEVQSSNEELEASKEETQSLNEELNTINAELNGKIEELDRANSDLRHLFESTQIATIFLDHALVIRTFTPAAATFFNLRAGDVGRPLTELSSQLDYPHLKDDIRQVFDTGRAHDEQLTRDRDGKYHLIKLIPYRRDHGTIDGVVVTLIDVTPIAEAEQRQQVLVSELNHRVKNMLAVVTSIATRTMDASPSLESFRPAFLGRLQAMARAYGALSREGWKDASVRTIFAAELDPFGEADIGIDGPELRVKPQVSLSLALVAHELATNASKYGSLSRKGGRVDVAWTVEDHVLHLSWREQGGPPVVKPEATGFGFELLHGEIVYRLQGKLDVAYDPQGLAVRMELPLRDGGGA
jgi:two-component system CheB/CheR fusion protein